MFSLQTQKYVYNPAPGDIYLTISCDLQLNLISQVEIISELFIMWMWWRPMTKYLIYYFALIFWLFMSFLYVKNRERFCSTHILSDLLRKRHYQAEYTQMWIISSMQRVVRRGKGPCVDAAEGSTLGGRWFSTSAAATEAPTEQRLMHLGGGGSSSRGLSSRDKFHMRSGSVFVKAELLMSATLLCHGVHVVGGELRVAVLCWTPRLCPTQPMASPAHGWSPTPSAQRSRLLLCCLFTHPSSLCLAAWVPMPGKLKHHRLRKPTQTMGSKVHTAASSSEINISAS